MIVEIIIKIDGKNVEYDNGGSLNNCENLVETLNTNENGNENGTIVEPTINYHYNHGVTDPLDIESAKKHVGEILEALKGIDIKGIEYYISDYYSEVSLKFESFNVTNVDNYIESVIEKLHHRSPDYEAFYNRESDVGSGFVIQIGRREESVSVDYKGQYSTCEGLVAEAHVEEIKRALKGKGPVHIKYYVNDYYASLLLNSDKSSSYEHGFDPVEIISLLNKESQNYKASLRGFLGEESDDIFDVSFDISRKS